MVPCPSSYQRSHVTENCYKHVHLTDATAKARMHDAFVQQLMPLRLLPVVAREYFTPSHQDFVPHTAWSLSNAFTHVAKTLPAGSRFRALVQPHGMADDLCGEAMVLASGGWSYSAHAATLPHHAGGQQVDNALDLHLSTTPNRRTT